jgi:hypothetical protein
LIRLESGEEKNDKCESASKFDPGRFLPIPLI